MKKLTALFLLVFSVSSFADKISFSYFGNSNGNQSYYACSYVEGQVEETLQIVGATNFDVNCTGGIQPNWSVGPVSIRATFTKPVTTGKVEEVEIKGDSFNPNCGLNVTIIKNILKAFPEIEVLKKSDGCGFSTSNYYYKLAIPR